MIDKIDKNFRTTKSTIYDTSSLTILESLGKFLEKVNEIVETVNTYGDRLTEVETTKLHEEVKNKFEELISDGTLTNVINSFSSSLINNTISDMLNSGELSNMTIEKNSITLEKLEDYFVKSILKLEPLNPFDEWRGYVNINGALILNPESSNILNVIDLSNIKYCVSQGISNIPVQCGYATLDEDKNVIFARLDKNNNYDNYFINTSGAKYLVYPKTNANITISFFKNINDTFNYVNEIIGNISDNIQESTIKKGFILSEGTISYNESSTYSIYFYEVEALHEYNIIGYNEEKCCAYALFDEEFNIKSFYGGGLESIYIEKTISIPNGIKYVGITIRDNNINLYKKISVEEKIKNTENNLLNEINKWKGKKILILGTSIPAGDGAKNTYPFMLSQILQCTVFNEAVGGSSVCCKLSSSTNFHHLPNDFSSAYRCLSNSLEEQEWIISQMSTGGIYAGNNLDSDYIRSLSYENKLIPYLNGTKEKPDLIILEHGANDLRSLENEVYDENNPYDLTNYYGAMNFLIKTIYEYDKDMNIMIMGHYENQSPKRVIEAGYDEYGARTIASRSIVPTKQLKVSEIWNMPILKSWELFQCSQMKITTKGKWINGIWKENALTNSRELTMLEYKIPDQTHPHSDKSGTMNLKIAIGLAKFILYKYPF